MYSYIKRLGKDIIKSLLDIQLIWFYEDNPREQIAAGKRWIWRVLCFRVVFMVCIALVLWFANEEVNFWLTRNALLIVAILLILIGISFKADDMLKRRIAALRRNRL